MLFVTTSKALVTTSGALVTGQRVLVDLWGFGR